MTAEYEVRLHGLVVGTLAEDPRGRWSLRFTDAYRSHHPRPVLGQKFEDDLTRAYRGKDPGDLPPFFANLVPDQEGELRPVLEQALGLAPGDDLSLLSALGRDLPGAVEVRLLSASGVEEPSHLDDAIGPAVPGARDQESMRFSLAGVQLKFSVLLAEEKISLPAHGALGEWLVKLDSKRFPKIPENEAAMMRWAREAGFDVPEFRLLSATDLAGSLGAYAPPDTSVLAVRRYDRTPAGGKVHQEDFAQVVNLAPLHRYDHVSYDQMARIIEQIMGGPARDEFIRRLVLMVACGNGDAHLKNWSLLYRDAVRPSLAPLYDQVATVAWPELSRTLALNLASTKPFSQLDAATFDRFAGRIQVSPDHVRGLVDSTLARLAGAWKTVVAARDFCLPEDHRERLMEHWRATPLLRTSALVRA